MKKPLTFAQQTASAPRHSEYLQKFMKKHPDFRIYAKDKPGTSLNDLLSMDLKDMTILIGPRSHYLKGKDYGKLHEIDAAEITRIIHGDPKIYCHINQKNQWFIDITTRFIEEYAVTGPCSFHDGYHDDIQISPKIRECTYCKRREYKRTVIKKVTEWSATPFGKKK